HEVRVAGREIRAEYRPLAEAELLDEQGEGNSDLSAGGPSGDMNRFARESGDRVASLLREARAGKMSGKQQCQPGDEAGVPNLSCHWMPLLQCPPERLRRSLRCGQIPIQNLRAVPVQHALEAAHVIV